MDKATSYFLLIVKIGSNFWDISDQSYRFIKVIFRKCKLKAKTDYFTKNVSPLFFEQLIVLKIFLSNL